MLRLNSWPHRGQKINQTPFWAAILLPLPALPHACVVYAGSDSGHLFSLVHDGAPRTAECVPSTHLVATARARRSEVQSLRLEFGQAAKAAHACEPRQRACADWLKLRGCDSTQLRVAAW